MLSKYFWLLLAFPFIEILILIKMGEVFGFWITFLGVIVVGFWGAALARLQGFRAWQNFQMALKQGQMPAEHLVDAFLILIAGLLLALPGLLTDVAGFLILIPWTRFYFKRWLRKKFDRALSQGNIRVSMNDRFSLH